MHCDHDTHTLTSQSTIPAAPNPTQQEAGARTPTGAAAATAAAAMAAAGVDGGATGKKPPAAAVAAAVMKTKSASSLRWAILVCASLLMLSNYYVYDVPASLYVCLWGLVLWWCGGCGAACGWGCVARPNNSGVARH